MKSSFIKNSIGLSGAALVTLALAMLSSQQAQSQVIASDNFAGYNTGVAVNTGNNTFGDNGGTGWANAWIDKGQLDKVQTGSLTYTDGLGNTLATSGNSLQSNGAANPATATSEPQRTLPSTFGQLAIANTAAPDTLWMSYLWQGNNTSATGSNFRQASVAFFKGAATSANSPGGTEYLDVGMPNISTATVGTANPNISLWTSSGNAGQLANGLAMSSLNTVQSSVAANTGATDLILIQMTGTATAWATAGQSETINVWINPTLTGSVPVGPANITYSGQDLSGLNSIRVAGGGYNSTYGALPGEQTFSSFLLGNTVGDVTPIAAAPEPASVSLAVAGGLGLLTLLRRKK